MNVLASSCLLQILLLLGQALAPAAPVPPHRVGLPEDFPLKIWVQEPLRAIVGQMWATSPTFHKQCLQIESAGAIQVQLRIDPALANSPSHYAACELRLYSDGAIVARVSVAPMRLPELIAHEMEHVCERLDGIRIEREARNRERGYYVFDPMRPRYESERAIRVGRQVMAEMSSADRLTRSQP
jgi:hypothetical protein